MTKSSTEAKLVGLSDLANQGISIRNFLISQGYTMGPMTVYQDNQSCSDCAWEVGSRENEAHSDPLLLGEGEGGHRRSPDRVPSERGHVH